MCHQEALRVGHGHSGHATGSGALPGGDDVNAAETQQSLEALSQRSSSYAPAREYGHPKALSCANR